MVHLHAFVACPEKPPYGRMSAGREVAYWIVDKNALALLARAEELLGQALLFLRILLFDSVLAASELHERL